MFSGIDTRKLIIIMFYEKAGCHMSSIRNSVSIEVKINTARIICASGMNVLISICRYARNRVAYLHLARLEPREVFLFLRLSFGINYLSKATSASSIPGKANDEAR